MATVDITWLDPSGRGGGRTGDMIIRVPGALPGERVAYREVHRKGKRVDGVLESVIEASPARTAPTCAWNSACGGCGLDMLRAADRGALLAPMVGRILGLEPAWVGSPRSKAHRARVKLALRGSAVGYRPGRSHDIVEVTHCGVARPEVNEALAELRSRLQSIENPCLESVELRSNGDRVVFAFESTRRGHLPRELLEALEPLGDVAVNGRRLVGDPRLDLSVCGVSLQAGPRAFYQVNLEVNALLVAHIVDAVAEAQPQRVLDLYGGIGNLGLPIAARTGVPVVVVDAEGQATDGARRAAEAAGLPVSVVKVDARRFDASREAFDIAVVDPPRSGAGKALAQVLRNRPRRVVLVACDPRAGSTDLRTLRDAGYRVQSATCFDMFPDTHHVETVVVADR